MRKLFCIFFIALSLPPGRLFAQRLCGAQMLKTAIIRLHPEAEKFFENQRNSLQAVANNYKTQMLQRAAERATSAPIVPVIFHIIVDSAQFLQMGGSGGISTRIDSQMVVLNRDYNRENPDSTAIPSGWQSRYGNVGIRFGLAHTAPGGGGSPGYEVRIISSAGFTGGATSNYDDAKQWSTGGLDAWDVNKYINVWCINFSDYPGLLGITVAKSVVTAGFEAPSREGICIDYLALGKQTSPPSLTFPTGSGGSIYDLGRTLTHEMGHYFEIWHVWGDDGGLCLWNGGHDDGIADTPPQADATNHNPSYTIPGGTITDGCIDSSSVDMQPIGIACLDYMDYTDDIGMHLFTVDQAAVMASQLTPAGENYSLTLNPDLLNWSPYTAVEKIATGNDFNVYPNPASTNLTVVLNGGSNDLKQISIIDILGREVKSVSTDGRNKDLYNISLSGMDKGIYFIRCNFASGSITRKILLQ